MWLVRQNGRLIASAVGHTNQRPVRVLFWLLLLLLACYRLTLTHTGHFYWADERCYLPVHEFIDALLHGDLRRATEHLFDAPGAIPPARPGFVLLSVIPAFAQRIVGTLTGLDPNTPAYYDVVSIFNLVVSLGTTTCMFRLAQAWTGRDAYAWLAALVYSLLCNANVWIRHLVPYQLSLFLFLWGLCLLSSKNHGSADIEMSDAQPPTYRVFMAGLLTALGYSCYPGHYAFVIINAAVAVLCSRRRPAAALAFGAPSALVLGVWEVLARWNGGSYWHDLRALSASAGMGDPREGLVFLWRYLRDTEGIVGIPLFVLCLVALAWAFFDRGNAAPRAARVPMIAAAAGYLFHASLGLVWGTMVFYGRVLTAFIPFLVLGAMSVLAAIRFHRLRRLAALAVVAASVFSFACFAFSYAHVRYPAEFLQETMTRRGRSVIYPPNGLWGFVDGSLEHAIERFDPSLSMVTDTRSDGCGEYVLLASHAEVQEAQPRFVGVNLSYLGYIREKHGRFTPPPGYELVAEAPHPNALPALRFEGHKPHERKRLRDRPYTMRIYERRIRGALGEPWKESSPHVSPDLCRESVLANGAQSVQSNLLSRRRTRPCCVGSNFSADTAGNGSWRSAIIIQVFIAQTQPIVPLTDELLDRVHDEFRITMIQETNRETANDSRGPFRFAQQQPTGVRRTFVSAAESRLSGRLKSYSLVARAIDYPSRSG